MIKKIKISTDFSPTPGARYASENSGEKFRQTFLEPLLNQGIFIEIDFDNVVGYSTAFLDEAFGVLSRKYGFENCIQKLSFISNDDPFLKDEIIQYMKGNL